MNQWSLSIEVVVSSTSLRLFSADSSDDWLVIQQTALEWIHQFILLSQHQMLPFTSGILCAILPCFAYATDARKEARSLAQHANHELLGLVKMESDQEEGARLAKGDSNEK